MKLAGKKALITGGNSGIGLATARLFISEGAEVAITGRDQRTLDEAVGELGSKAHAYRADVTVAEDRKKLFADLAKDFGKLDIVFANAGISGRTPTGTTDEVIFEKVVHTNLNGAFFTVNSAAPLMNDNGSIIFNGSVHNYLGQPGVAAYATTKGGLVSMARSIAADLAGHRRAGAEGRFAGDQPNSDELHFTFDPVGGDFLCFSGTPGISVNGRGAGAFLCHRVLCGDATDAGAVRPYRSRASLPSAPARAG